MNYIKHLSSFFARTTADPSLSPTHISMYMALFQFWNANRFKNPVTISRSEVMTIAKINSVATYHKCMKDLNNLSYIRYEPSYKPFAGSRVTMVEFFESTAGKKKCSKQSAATSATRSITCPVTPVENSQQLDSYRSKTPLKNSQLKEPSINSINNTNIINNNSFCVKKNKPKNEILENEEKSEKNEAEKQGSYEKKDTVLNSVPERKEKSSGKKEMKAAPGENIPPGFAEVKLHFAEKQAPAQEAEKFFNHYESNGWLVGGRSKMKNWHAAARNWQLNARKFASQHNAGSIAPRPNNLNATTNKSYREEL